MPDLSQRELRRHPIYQLLNDQAAAGGLPSKAELDALQLSSTARRSVSEAATAAVATKATGNLQQARVAARAAAEQIIASLPSEFQSPDYLQPPDETSDDPAALAARVPRW